MPPLKAQLLLEESLSAYFPEMVFTDSGITVQLHRNTQSPMFSRDYAQKVLMSPSASSAAGLACRVVVGTTAAS
ncbi:hypothetical protein, partial [Aeromonas caviae]|uniref:hypothetical protein n=1 Tax=Aeromonas caviae TaxID=648 RepID=UPI001CC535F5